MRPSKSHGHTTGHGTRSRLPWESPGKQPGSCSPTEPTPDQPDIPLNGYGHISSPRLAGIRFLIGPVATTGIVNAGGFCTYTTSTRPR